jgi:hypothetical protein
MLNWIFYQPGKRLLSPLRKYVIGEKRAQQQQRPSDGAQQQRPSDDDKEEKQNDTKDRLSFSLSASEKKKLYVVRSSSTSTTTGVAYESEYDAAVAAIVQRMTSSKLDEHEIVEIDVQPASEDASAFAGDVKALTVDDLPRREKAKIDAYRLEKDAREKKSRTLSKRIRVAEEIRAAFPDRVSIESIDEMIRQLELLRHDD